MSTKSQELAQQANIVPFLNLVPKNESGVPTPNGPHRVKFLGDKIIKGNDFKTKQEIDVVRYTFEEDGIAKKYDVAVKDEKGDLKYFIQKMSEYNYGDEIILEGKRDSEKIYISIKSVSEGRAETGFEEEEIPVFNK